MADTNKAQYCKILACIQGDHLLVQNRDLGVSLLVDAGDLSGGRRSKQRDEPSDVAGGQEIAEKPRKHLNRNCVMLAKEKKTDKCFNANELMRQVTQDRTAATPTPRR